MPGFSLLAPRGLGHCLPVHRSKLTALALLMLTLPAWAEDPEPGQDEAQAVIDSFPWQREGTAKLGAQATLTIPPTFRFLTGAQASKLVERMGNLSSHKELGLIGTDDLGWFVLFFFDDVGYVKDDEKDELDAEKMAETMRENLVASNEERKEHNLEELNFDGWAIPPRYNPETKQLEWAHRLRSVNGVSVNYNTRVLGRRGVMRVILVTDPELLQATLPAYADLMKGFQFTAGEDYSSFKAGDKVAEYGLIALVAGGAGAVAAKTGLLSAVLVFFKKGAKLIVIGVAALAAFLKKLFTGKKDSA